MTPIPALIDLRTALPARSTGSRTSVTKPTNSLILHPMSLFGALILAGAILAGCGDDSSPPADDIDAGDTDASAPPPVDAGTPDAPPPTITCLDNIDQMTWEGDDATMRDMLYGEVIAYLDAYRATLAAGMGACSSATATTDTETVSGGKVTGCIGDYPDVAAMVAHLQLVVDNPDEAKKCFDPTMSTVVESFRGNTPSDELKMTSAVAQWLDRPTYSEVFTGQDPIAGFINEFADDFLEILQNTVHTPERWPTDPTIAKLPHLWASVGWIPFYADRPEAGSDRFRGGYAYSEIMGEFGMLKIDTINDEIFQGEIGLTVQRAASFYPSHFHFPQEIYISLTPPSCAGQYQYFLIDEESTLTDADDWQPYFIDMDPKDEWLFYIETNNLHSFIVGDCGGQAAATGLVASWARTVIRDGRDQSTNICMGASGETPGELVPETKFVCNTD